MSYEQIGPDNPFFEMVQAAKRDGRWMCDAVDHNEPEGCSNPECFKHIRWMRQPWQIPQVSPK